MTFKSIKSGLFTLVCILLIALPWTGNAAEEEAPQASAPDASAPESGQPGKMEPDSGAPEQPAYPGVTNNVLKRGGDGAPALLINYPAFVNNSVNDAMRSFALEQADDYEKDIQESLGPDDEKPANYSTWELSGFYTVEKPNPDVASVTFNIYSYSGGAHGNLFIRCLNYDLVTGRQLVFDNLFKDREKALQLLSEISGAKLRAELGEEADEEMIKAGSAPDLNNFLNLSLAPQGLFIEFQPYQVGPWSIGPQRVEITLADLAAAGPNPAIWPDAAKLEVPATQSTLKEIQEKTQDKLDELQESVDKPLDELQRKTRDQLDELNKKTQETVESLQQKTRKTVDSLQQNGKEALDKTVEKLDNVKDDTEKRLNELLDELKESDSQQ